MRARATSKRVQRRRVSREETARMPKKRCAYPGCRRKIKPIDAIQGACRCGKLFCSEHRLPEVHGGDHSWEKDTSSLGGGVPKKMEKIDDTN